MLYYFLTQWRARQIVARRRDGVEDRLAALLAVVNLQAAGVEFVGWVVESDRHRRRFLNGRDEVGQQIEHVLRRHAHRLRAVDVQRDVIRAEIGLQLGELRIRGHVAIVPRAGGASERVVDQLADELKRPSAL